MKPYLIFAAVFLLEIAVIICEVTEKDNILDELTDLLERGLKDRARTKNRRLTKVNRVTFQVCPVPDMIHVTTRDEPKCRKNRDCGRDELCCDWFDSRHCLKSVDVRPRQGTCPASTQINDICRGGYLGCRYDNDCFGEDDKCCMGLCGYKECRSIRQNIACPEPQTWFPTNRTEVECTKDTECGFDERCCHWFGSQHCLKGVSTIPKPGPCPFSQEEELSSACLADSIGCQWDSECDSHGINFKCCYNSKCGYGECKDMNKDFSCPILDPEIAAANPTEGPSTCSAEDNQACPGFGQLCCQSGLSSNGDVVYSCKEGIIHTPKPGVCPSADLLSDPHGECLQDYEGGCTYDSECAGPTRKCCQTSCGYSECVEVGNSAGGSSSRLLVTETVEGPGAQSAVALSSFVAPPPGHDQQNQPQAPPLKRLLEELLDGKAEGKAQDKADS